VINGNWPLPTPSPSPELTPTPQSSEIPIKVVPTTAEPAPTPYMCSIEVHVAPLPNCIDWVKWWWETDGDSWQNYLGTNQFYGIDGFYKQWWNFTDYAKWVAIWMECQKGGGKTPIVTESFFYNFTPQQMNIIVSNASWMGPQSANSWYVWCAEKKVPYTAIWASYSADKSNPKPLTITGGPDGAQAFFGNIWMFATTLDDTKVAKVDFYKNGTFWRTELNPPYDFMPSAGPYAATKEGFTMLVGALTTLKNGTVLPMEEGWLLTGHIPAICGDHYCTGDETLTTCPQDCTPPPTPTPTPAPTPIPVPVCGDTECNGAETCATCPGDCGVCPPRCGDNNCNGDETCKTCPGDCGPCPTCDCCQWCGTGTDLGTIVRGGLQYICEYDSEVDAQVCKARSTGVIYEQCAFPATIDGMDFTCEYDSMKGAMVCTWWMS
jgi:hypothetical protein